eukprot:GHVR01161398.1.p1 GENE.GHVR01161398.1~~GHVR01161398.1.p1  ORF type:complete len:132 (+),score=16.81 GHVR01161398.1:371-766(+)
MTQDIYKSIPGLEKAMAGMDVEKIAGSMDAFERLFEDLVGTLPCFFCILLHSIQDVRTEYVTNAVDSATASATPVDQVDTLIQQVGEEHALDVSGMMNNAPSSAPVQNVAVPVQPQAVDPLEERLNNLRGG